MTWDKDRSHSEPKSTEQRKMFCCYLPIEQHKMLHELKKKGYILNLSEYARMAIYQQLRADKIYLDQIEREKEAAILASMD